MVTSLMFVWYLIACAVLLGLTMTAIIRRHGLRLILSTMMFLVGLGMSYVGMFSLTGLPAPVWLMFAKPHVEEAEILAAFIEEDIGIFVLLQANEIGPMPKYYWFGYSAKAAEHLQKAMRKARGERGQEGDGRLMMARPFEKSLEDRDDEVFHDPPQPARPDKGAPVDNVITVPR